MAEMTTNIPRRRHARRRGAEFYTYFTLILLFSLPTETVRYVVEIAKRRTLNLRGPLARAWAEAEHITPMIFSV